MLKIYHPLRTGLAAILITCGMVTTASAKSSKRTFVITSNVEGAEVTALNRNNKKKSILGSCTTPCELILKSKKLTDFKFTHPDYPDIRLRKDKLGVQNWDQNTVDIFGKFTSSLAELVKKTDLLYREKYAEAYSEALSGPDTGPKYLIRRPPIYPHQVKEPGWCKASYNVSDGGQVVNANILSCSDMVFAKNTLKSIMSWRFIPAVRNGEFVNWKDREAKITFAFNDRDGNPLPIPPEP